MLRCMKLLGIGMINAFALLAIIGEVRRFDDRRSWSPTLGSTPASAKAGQARTIKLGIGKRGRGRSAPPAHPRRSGGAADGPGQGIGTMGMEAFCAQRQPQHCRGCGWLASWWCKSGTCSRAIRPRRWIRTKASRSSFRSSPCIGRSLASQLQLCASLTACTRGFEAQPSTRQYGTMKMSPPSRTSLMGAVRPQTPHRSPR